MKLPNIYGDGYFLRKDICELLGIVFSFSFNKFIHIKKVQKEVSQLLAMCKFVDEDFPHRKKLETWKTFLLCLNKEIEKIDLGMKLNKNLTSFYAQTICTKCEYDRIVNEYNWCPICGEKIEWDDDPDMVSHIFHIDLFCDTASSLIKELFPEGLVNSLKKLIEKDIKLSFSGDSVTCSYKGYKKDFTDPNVNFISIKKILQKAYPNL